MGSLLPPFTFFLFHHFSFSFFFSLYYHFILFLFHFSLAAGALAYCLLHKLHSFSHHFSTYLHTIFYFSGFLSYSPPSIPGRLPRCVDFPHHVTPPGQRQLTVGSYSSDPNYSDVVLTLFCPALPCLACAFSVYLL